LAGARRNNLINLNRRNLKMNRKLLLVIAVLALSACHAKKPKEVEVAPVPVVQVVVPTPAPVAEPVVEKPVEAAVVAVTVSPTPVVAAPVPVTETKPDVVVAPQPIKPVVAPKPTAPTVIIKPAVASVPAAPKVVAAAISDADGIALAKKRNCFACHMIDKKVVGPAWKDVAVKYRGDAGAQARLEAKVAKGGSGVWGSMVMPAQSQATPEERAVLVRFILNLK
jgi:cytochrome c